MKLKDATKRNQNLYIAQAAVEYLLSLLVTGSFLATITKSIGIPDSITGVLSSVISLGCSFQLISLFIHKQKTKGFVIVMSIINQILFLALYVIPILNISQHLKTILFAVVIVAAYFVYNIAHPKKINWLMSNVDENHRGIFTANKEIISLVAGMAFSYGAGALSDYFAEKGDINTAFILFAALSVVLTLVHTITLLPITEEGVYAEKKVNFGEALRSLFKNKNIVKVVILFAIYYVIKDIAAPFYGVYQINDLGFSLKLVTVLTVVSSISRILVSRFLGRYADRKGFATMVEKCFIFLTLGYAFVAFATPTTGVVMFIGYYVCNGIAMGGINSAITNMVFYYIEPERRADSLAVSQAVAGIIGFLTTIAVSPLVTLIQKDGNRFLGIPIYAQQFLSVLAVVMCVVAVIFVRLAIIGKNKAE
ncbi:MAG: MFS transporter [Clostridia bacterium]|nr:MFS transporter [Clostridia bacterium]